MMDEEIKEAMSDYDRISREFAAAESPRDREERLEKERKLRAEQFYGNLLRGGRDE